MKHCFLIALLSLASVSFARAADRANGPAPDVPELKVLNYWVGKWDDELTVKPIGDVRGGTSKGPSVSEWVHEGRFVRQTWAFDGSATVPKLSGSSMMTYDPQKKVYRTWTFFSNGYVSEATGNWDAKTRTMTSTTRDGDLTTTTIATFAADGKTEQWSIVTKDQAGKTYSDTRGTNTRR